MPSTYEIAAHLGVSQARVVQLIGLGMPKNSLKAADRWRAERGTGKRAATNSKTSKFADEPDEPKTMGRPKSAKQPSRTGDSLLDALLNSIAVADGAFEDYEYARIHRLGTRSVRLSEHNKAIDSRLKAEKAYREELERRRLIVPIQEAMDVCRRTMEPVLRRLKKIPAEVGPQVNPQDALTAVKILEGEVNAVIAIGRKALDALKDRDPNAR